MAKVITIDGRWAIHCPACRRAHVMDERWGFNNDFENPTFTPSILSRFPTAEDVCHSFVKDGAIQFLSDSTHELAGKTVPLVVWDPAIGPNELDKKWNEEARER